LNLSVATGMHKKLPPDIPSQTEQKFFVSAWS